METIIISGGCTPSVTVEIDFDENINGNPVVWMKTGYKQGVSAPLNKEAVLRIIVELHGLFRRM